MGVLAVTFKSCTLCAYTPPFCGCQMVIAGAVVLTITLRRLLTPVLLYVSFAYTV